MSDEKKYTERDLLLAKREGFMRGAKAAWGNPHAGKWNGLSAECDRAYPLPKITRPRVVKDEREGYWYACDGSLRWSVFGDATGGIEAHGSFRTELVLPTPTRVAMWADLLANPTEEVDA